MCGLADHDTPLLWLLALCDHCHLSAAFDTLLAAVDELKLDYPEAPKILAYFVGRAIADDVMHPKFLQERKDLSNASAAEVWPVLA